jgi:hypothetical protein
LIAQSITFTPRPGTATLSRQSIASSQTGSPRHASTLPEDLLTVLLKFFLDVYLKPLAVDYSRFRGTISIFLK